MARPEHAGGERAGGRQGPATPRPAGRRDAAVPAPAVDEPEVGEVLAPETLDELRETARPHAFGDAARALAEAVAALSEEDDPQVAVRAAQAAKRAAPRAASVREALGIALYQAGDFRAARTELAASQRISGRVDLAALLADIERALGRPERAVALFERTDRSRMGPDAAAELLLVAASAYGDLGKPAAGVALIRRHARWPVELADHHLRLAYAEGALAEQAGDLARARDALARVVRAEPDFHDAAERLERLAGG
jgi:tetratricopeptide (TPR) repeat protein